MPSKTRLYAAFAAVYFIWGSTYLAIRFTVETIPPLLAAGLRFMVSGVILYAFARRIQHVRKPSKENWKAALMIGALMLLGGNGVIVSAQKYVPSGLASLLVATVPLWMVLVHWLIFGEKRPRPGVFAGLALGSFGVWLLAGPHASGQIHSGAAAAILIGSFSWSVGSVYSHKANLPDSPLLTVGMQMIAGGSLLLAAAFLRGETAAVLAAPISFKSAAALVYLTLVGSLVGFTAYIWLLKNAGVARTSTYAFVNPAVAVFLGWAFAGETLTSRAVTAAAFIIAAVVIITLNHQEPEPIAV